MTSFFDRRAFILTSFCGAMSGGVRILSARQTTNPDPWSQDELLSPADLAKELSPGGEAPKIICVTFPILYRQKHIAHAVIAGPGNKPEGLDALRRATTGVAKESEIVLYCGCCPMEKCPNIRPAYRVLKEQTFEKVRVLNLPTNFHTDWVVKGYPIET